MNNRSQSGLAKKVDNAFSLEKNRSISCKKSLPRKAYRCLSRGEAQKKQINRQHYATKNEQCNYRFKR